MSLFRGYFDGPQTAGTLNAPKERGFLRSGIFQQAPVFAETKSKAVVHPHDHQAVLTETTAQRKWLDGLSRCVYCGLQYRRRDNIGRMKCRWHPAVSISSSLHECCGRVNDPGLNNGCRSCDHSAVVVRDNTRWHPENDHEVFPLAVAIEFGIPRDTYDVITTGTLRSSKAVIKRCNY